MLTSKKLPVATTTLPCKLFVQAWRIAKDLCISIQSSQQFSSTCNNQPPPALIMLSVIASEHPIFSRRIFLKEKSPTITVTSFFLSENRMYAQWILFTELLNYWTGNRKGI